jgi:serine/threonine protein kinase
MLSLPSLMKGNVRQESFAFGDNFHFPVDALQTHHNISRSFTEYEFFNVSYLCPGSNSFISSATRNGELMVVKIIKKNIKNSAIAEEELHLELQLLSKIDHPNIITIKGAGNTPRSFIAVEHLGGGTLDQGILSGEGSLLKSVSKKSSSLKLSVLLPIAKQLVSALKYLHEDLHPMAMIIHRGDIRPHMLKILLFKTDVIVIDLKPENIGFTADKTLKLFDFGLAACVRKKLFANEAYKMTGFTGTMAYMAPEVALRKPYNEKVDIYSFGIILWQMLTGETPFDGMSKAVYMERVALGGLRPSIPRDVPKDLTMLIQQCWDQDPKRRPSCTVILAALDGLINASIDNSGGLLSFIPRLFSRKVCKIVPDDFSATVSDITIPYPELSFDESTVDEFSIVRKDSFCGSRNISPPSNNCIHNSTSALSLQQTPTNPIMKLSSLKRRTIRRKRSPRK